MNKSLIDDRIIFPNYFSQGKFLSMVKQKRQITLKKFAEELGISVRTLTDWMNGSYRMVYSVAIYLSKSSNINLPRGIKKIRWKDHVSMAGKIGASINLNKNGSIGGSKEFRIKRWREWWESKGRFKKQSILISRAVKFPRHSVNLAEFVGIMLGDGGITKYCINITLHRNEKKYAVFVSDLINRLFGVYPKIYLLKSSRALNITVYRKKIVEFLEKKGLVYGNKVKSQVTIPLWINKRKKFKIACIRGLVDTDGCFFVHSYKVNNKIYQYIKIDFTNRSKILLHELYKILINLGFNVRICKSGDSIRIESQKCVEKYLREIGTNNIRNIEKLRKWRVALNGKAAVC